MKARAREIGIPFGGKTGKHNAITDVPEVMVGQTTIIQGEGKLEIGNGPVRTGVTALLPTGYSHVPVFAAWYSINGCGEMTGTTWVEESGMLHSPVMMTNTLSIGTVYRATIDWVLETHKVPFGLPVVTETYDGYLNDIHGFHVKSEHVYAALENARVGAVPEGNIGGGTGMKCYDFKGGIGTASRVVQAGSKHFTVGVLVQANHGSRSQLMIAGVPVGQEIRDLMPENLPQESSAQVPVETGVKTSSIIAIVATDLPLLPHQLKRLARRVPLGLARTGAVSEYTSGDIFLAFSNADPGKVNQEGFRSAITYDDWRLDPFFEAVVQATEEAVVNALLAAETMTGINGYTVYALPHDRLRILLRKYNRLNGD
jgi:D-aminopeptidase